MRCEDALNQLNARADGELPTEGAAELDAHLAECAQCKAAADELQAVDGELRHAFVGRRDAAARLAERTAAMVRQSVASASIAPVPQAAPVRGPNTRWWPA